MAILTLFSRAGLIALALCGLAANPALACSTCGCGLPGSASEISSVVGPVNPYNGQFLIQTSLSLRDVTGSFNDRGTWNPKPTGSSLLTAGGGLGITYFPSDTWNVGLQVPFAANRLAGAQWAAQGAINPLDDENGPVPPQYGGGLSDITLQGSYVALQSEEWWPSVSLWAGLVLPTGASSGDAAGFTGGGSLSGQIGVSAFRSFGAFEAFGNLGYQGPLANGTSATQTAFYVGQAFIGQAQVYWNLTPEWKLGLSAMTVRAWISDPSVAATASSLGKIKLSPSVEWRFTPEHSIRVAYGADPTIGPWLNSMTDQTLSVVYSRYF
ncbi:MAG TPA: transporter [Stenomitos sp.]